MNFRALLFLAPALFATLASGEVFQLPTANRAIYEAGAEEKAFAATPGKTWASGTFGCVRSDGWQIHEGLDIRSVQHDRHGEPTDPVMASAEGTVAYVNTRPSLSNYGNYIVLRHQIEGMEIFTLYAHLQSVREGLKSGQAVKAGEVIGIMGRTANTRESITKDRAHVHFEIDLLVNDRFADWYRKNSPGQRNDHGNWNGQNLNAIDARAVFLEQHRQGDKFSLVHFIRSETELCRVAVRSTSFPWLKRYAPLIQHNSVAEKEGVAGYEVAFDFNGVAIQLIPRAASEMKFKGKYALLSVNADEEKKNPARRFVSQRGGRWELTAHGQNMVDLFIY